MTFLHSIRPGGADRSYGIEVARLAGLPASLLSRAREILSELEQQRPSRLAGRSRRRWTSVSPSPRPTP